MFSNFDVFVALLPLLLYFRNNFSSYSLTLFVWHKKLQAVRYTGQLVINREILKRNASLYLPVFLLLGKLKRNLRPIFTICLPYSHLDDSVYLKACFIVYQDNKTPFYKSCNNTEVVDILSVKIQG